MNQRTDCRYFRLLALLGVVALLAGCAHRYEDRYDDRYSHDRSYHVDETVYGSGGFSVGASYHRSSYWYDPFWSPGYSFGYSYAPTFFIYRDYYPRYIYRDYYPRYHDHYWNRPSWRHHGRTAWYAPSHPWYGNRRPHTRGSALPTAGQTAGEATRLSRQPPARNRSVHDNHLGNDLRDIRRSKATEPTVGEATRLTRPSVSPARSTPPVRSRQTDPAPVIRQGPRGSERADRSRSQSNAPAERPAIHRQTRPEPREMRPSLEARPTVRDTRSTRSHQETRYRATTPQSPRPAVSQPQRGTRPAVSDRSTYSRPTPAQRPVQSRSAPAQRPVQSRPAPVQSRPTPVQRPVQQRSTPSQRPVQQRSAPTQRPVQRQSAPAQRPSPPPTVRSRSGDESDNRSSRRR